MLACKHKQWLLGTIGRCHAGVLGFLAAEMEAIMRKSLKAAHMLGLALFLGSIGVYIVLTTQTLAPGTPAFAALRQQILLGTRCITFPGLLATLGSGLGLLWLNRHALQRWQIAKAMVGCLLLFNTWLLVGPAVQSAADLSAIPAFSEAATVELRSALKIETVAGALNVALAFLEIWLAVFRPVLGRRQWFGRARLREAPESPSV
jgi:hypothetical protein